MDPFRLAIVGCGKIATSHAEAALVSPLTELVALVDPVPERAQALAARFDVSPVIARDIADVRTHVDGAIIATPNHTHVALAETCLAAGIHVLIEKPLAMSPAEGTRICEAARLHDRTVAVGYVTRFRDNVRLMGTLIREHYFGRVHRFAYQFGTRGGWAPVSGYNLNTKTSGGGVLVVSGTHFLDRMLSWFDYPSEVALADDANGGPEANCVAHFRFGGVDGFEGIARFSKTSAMPAGFVMETERGTVLMLDRSDAPLILRPTNRADVEHLVRARAAGSAGGDEFVLQLEDFVTACRTRQAPMISGEEGLRSLTLLDALYRHRTPLGATVDTQKRVTA